jgi:hypothetical protein
MRCERNWLALKPIDGDGVQHIWCLGPKVNGSPEVVLERFLVLLLTREKVALCKLQTLKT